MSNAPTAVEAAQQRAVFLERLWWATANAALSALGAKEPSASALQAARTFLRDNGITLANLPSLRGRFPGAPFAVGPLPTFRDDDDTAVALPEELKNVPPFAKPAAPTT